MNKEKLVKFILSTLFVILIYTSYRLIDIQYEIGKRSEREYKRVLEKQELEKQKQNY